MSDILSLELRNSDPIQASTLKENVCTILRAMSVTSPSGREGSPSPSLAASVSGGMKELGPLVGAIDQGTGSTRFLVFAANTAELVTCE